MRLAIILVLIVSGCLTGRTVERYVCSDGWLVNSPEECKGHERDCPRCAQTVCKSQECNNTVYYVCTTTTLGEGTPTTIASAREYADACLALDCPAGTMYVSSKSSGKYHRCDCRFAQTLSTKNRVCFSDRQEAEAEGKTPCGICIH